MMPGAWNDAEKHGFSRTPRQNGAKFFPSEGGYQLLIVIRVPG